MSERVVVMLVLKCRIYMTENANPYCNVRGDAPEGAQKIFSEVLQG